MTYDQHLQRRSHKISPPEASSPKRDDRFSWLLYLYGGRMLLAGAMILVLAYVMLDGGKEPFRASDGGPFAMLLLIFALYGILMGLCILARLRVAWVLLVIGKTLSLAFELLVLGVDSAATFAQQLNGRAGSELLSGSYLGAALSVAILIFLLGRKDWFYR